MTNSLENSPTICEENNEYITYREAIRHTYDDSCFYFIDRVYDCGDLFIDSLKTSVAIEFKNYVRRNESFLKPIELDHFMSSDQLTDINAICNGTIQNCFQAVKPLEPCEGYALEKALNCSMHDYVDQPFKHFRCDEPDIWKINLKKNGQSSRQTFSSIVITFILCSIYLKSL